MELCPVEHINALTKHLTLPIHPAALGGSLEAFKWLRSHGSKNTPDDDGQLPLHLACTEGQATIIREFRGSENIQLVTKIGWLPIHLAAFNNHLEAIKALQDIGAEIDAKSQSGWAERGGLKDFTYTALSIAALRGYDAIAMYLIEHGADIDIEGEYGTHLIHHAASNGSRDLFLILFHKGQDLWSMDEADNTPLHFAASEGKTDIVREYIELNKNNPAALDTENYLGITPLMSSFEANQPETAVLLLSAGAKLDHRSKYGYNSLLLAMNYPNEDILNKYFQNFHELDATDCCAGKTALHIASTKSSLPACKFLISHGANVNIRAKDGSTPLFDAANASGIEVFRFLLLNGSDPTLEDKFGRTVFDYAKHIPAILTLATSHCQQRIVKSQSELNEITEEHLRDLISTLSQIDPLRRSVERDQFSFTVFEIGKGLSFLGDYEFARLCLEARIFGSPYFERELDYKCDLCDKDDGFVSFWQCKQCPALPGMCAPCYESRTEGNIIPGCSIEHEFWEIGGEE